MNSFVEAAVYVLSLDPVFALIVRVFRLDDESVNDNDLLRTRSRSGPRAFKKLIAHLSPRLGVLNNIPFALPFETRVAIFRMFVDRDAARSEANILQQAARDVGEWRAYRNLRADVKIRRGHIATDGFDRLNDINLKRPIYITFIDQFGNEE